MPKFVYVYHIHEDLTGVDNLDEWDAWFGSLPSDSVIIGAPVGRNHVISNSGISHEEGPNPVTGVTIIDAPNMALACEYATTCPLIVHGTGSIEVAEFLDL